MQRYRITLHLYFRRTISNDYYNSATSYLNDVDDEYRVPENNILLASAELNPTQQEIDEFMRTDANKQRVVGGLPPLDYYQPMYEDYADCCAPFAEYGVTNVQYDQGILTFDILTDSTDSTDITKRLSDNSLEDGMYGGWPCCTGTVSYTHLTLPTTERV